MSPTIQQLITCHHRLILWVKQTLCRLQPGRAGSLFLFRLQFAWQGSSLGRSHCWHSRRRALSRSDGSALPPADTAPAPTSDHAQTVKGRPRGFEPGTRFALGRRRGGWCRLGIRRSLGPWQHENGCLLPALQPIEI